MEDWYRITLYRLIEVCKCTMSKYTRSKVRKALPEDFAYVIEELITEKPDLRDKEFYYNAIINSIIETERAEEFIVALSGVIQRLTVDHLHIVGDIYDRGPAPHIIMDRLMEHHSVDIQWGNHDVLWMGAAAGQRGCIANVIRICARYGNLDILEGRLRHQSAPPGLLLPWTPTGTTLLLLCPEGKRRRHSPGAGDGDEDAQGHLHHPVQGGGADHPEEPRI